VCSALALIPEVGSEVFASMVGRSHWRPVSKRCTELHIRKHTSYLRSLTIRAKSVQGTNTWITHAEERSKTKSAENANAADLGNAAIDGVAQSSGLR